MKMSSNKRSARKKKETNNRSFKLYHEEKGNYCTPRKSRTGKFGKAKPKRKEHR